MHLDNCTENDRRRMKASCECPKGREVKNPIGLRIRSDEKSSYEEHREDALAPYADEGRGKLRKAASSRKQASIRGYPNGGTRRE